MNPRQSVLRKVLKDQKRKYSSLFCIETGCIRFLRDADGHSTKVFGEEMREKDVLHSFEIDQENIKTAKKICKDFHGITFHLGDSLKMLPKVLQEVKPPQIHVAYLDSVNNADHIFNEFEIVEPYLKSGSILVVDDITCESCKKGKKILSYLKAKEEWSVEIIEVANGMMIGRKNE